MQIIEGKPSGSCQITSATFVVARKCLYKVNTQSLQVLETQT